MKNDAVKYAEMDKARDPSGVRAAWILELLKVRPRYSSELFFLAEKNGLGFAQSTYTRDLKGLIQRRLVWRDGKNKYGIEAIGEYWLEEYKKENAA